MLLYNLRRRPTRSFLTALGIALGVATIVLIGSVSAGLANVYMGVYSGGGAYVLVYQAGTASPLLSNLREDLRSRLAAFPEVKQVSPMVFGFVSTAESAYFLIYGYEPGSAAMERFRIVAGRGLTPQPRGREVILGRQAARNLKKQVGDLLTVSGAHFRIVGIYETGLAFEDAGAVIHLDEAQQFFKKPNQVSAFQLTLKDPRLESRLRARIAATFPDLTVSSASDLGEAQVTSQIVDGFGAAMSLIVVLVGGLGMMNTNLMSVFERTREIGVLRAFGWTRSQILLMVLGESVVLSLAGAAVGMGLGTAGAELLRQVPAVASIANPSLSVGLYIQALVVAVAAGLLSGAYPAWRAAKLTPVEAMRAEEGGRFTAVNIPAAVGTLGTMALRNLLRRPVRTALTAGGIGIGVAIIAGLGALTEGFVAQTNALFSGAGADLVAMQAEAADMSLSQIDEAVLRQLSRVPGVERVSGIALGTVLSRDTPLAVVLGVSPTDKYLTHYRIVEGRQILGSRETIIGRKLADSLKKRVGDTLLLLGRQYRVVGIFETGVGYEDTAAVIPLREFQTLFNRPRLVSFVAIKLRPGVDAEATRRQLESQFKELAVSQTAEFARRTQDIQNTQALATFLSIIAVVAGGIGILNSMLMSVYERTWEIGMLRAIGWSRGIVLRMVLREALVLSTIAGLAGIAISWVGLMGLQLAPAFGSILQPVYTAQLLLQVGLTVFILGLLGGAYPAYRAASLLPVDALRYE